MKACPDRKETMMLDVYGELDPETAWRWEEHLEACGACRGERSRLEALIGRIRAAEAPAALSAEESGAMLAELHRRTDRRRRRFASRRSLIRGLPALAAAATLIVAVVLFQERGPVPGPSPPAVSPVDIYGQLSEEDREVIRNLDMLKQFQTIEKLSRVVDVAGESRPDENPEQGASRNDPYDVYA